MIPEKHQEFCKAVGRLCREFELKAFQGSFRPGTDSEWHNEIRFDWSSGRHEADVGKISISSQVWVRAQIDGEEKG